jgi:hypothetical protein
LGERLKTRQHPSTTPKIIVMGFGGAAMGRKAKGQSEQQQHIPDFHKSQGTVSPKLLRLVSANDAVLRCVAFAYRRSSSFAGSEIAVQSIVTR